jgi:hypothetical protein
MAMLLTILGFGLFIFAVRTINRWDGGRIPIQMHIMIAIVGVVVFLVGLYLLTAPQVAKSIPSDAHIGKTLPAAASDPMQSIVACATARIEPVTFRAIRHTLTFGPKS